MQSLALLTRYFLNSVKTIAAEICGLPFISLLDKVLPLCLEGELMSLRQSKRLSLSFTWVAGSFCLAIAAIIFSAVMIAGRTQSATRSICYQDLPNGLRPWLNSQGFNDRNFAARISDMVQKNIEREKTGEFDHLIFYLLQSSRFSKQTRIEPAFSSYQFVQGLTETQRLKFLAENSYFVPLAGQIPAPVKARMKDFISAINDKSGIDDERLEYFRGLINRNLSSDVNAEKLLCGEYARAMRFLYLKEFGSRQIKQDQLADYVAELYRNRGHSTDTQVEANFAVYAAIATLKALQKNPDKDSSSSGRLNNVLIVGPGLDFAPRTDLIDLFGPQSYQPFAVADALIGLNLADESRLKIHCIDINDRVIGYLQSIGRRHQVRLSILSGLKDSAEHPLTDDFKDYFRGLGDHIGAQESLNLPSQYSGHLSKSLLIRPAIIRSISVDRLNVVTDRYQVSPQYDLVIVTNVFPYFSKAELLFALANIASMMREGGHLIHNELQSVPPEFVVPLGLPLQQARTVMISSGKNSPLFDGVAIHHKTKSGHSNSACDAEREQGSAPLR